jgi:pilus assembly protein CpaF
MYFFAKGKKQVMEDEDLASFEDILDALKNYIVDLIKEDGKNVKTDEEYKRLYKRKAKINDSLKSAVYGIDSAKVHVQELIHAYVEEKVPLDRVEQVLGIDNDSEPSPNVMFEIIMYRYKKRYSRNALKNWILKNDFHLPKEAAGIVIPGDKDHYITSSDLEESYYKEKILLSNDEKIDILTVLLYQRFKGYGMVDTISEMNINGYNIGVSGSIMDSLNSGAQAKHENGSIISGATNALWLYFGGNYIHLQFLDFGSEDEIRRIIQLLIRYNSPGPLSAKRGYIINTMHDKSRILALRPPVAEYWAAFVRKFTLDDITPVALIVKEGVTDGELCVKLIQFIMRGLITTAVTGRQGSGKTTLMKAIISFYDPRYNIGVLEMAPELYLREIYHFRNIISVQETANVSMEELQDAFKKADRAITIVGEVATDAVAARMIQLAMTGSLCTLFSHHANTAKDLILTLRNSLVNAGGFSNMTVAEKQVTDVVKINIHLDLSAEGKRYINRVTEIVQLEEGIPYPYFDKENQVESVANIQREYYTRETDRVTFETNDILTYDVDTDTYKVGECMSDLLYNKIRATLTNEERLEFDSFIKHYWKGIKTKGYEGVTNVVAEKSHNGNSNNIADTTDFKKAIRFLSGADKTFGFGDFNDTSEEEGR